MDLSEGGEFTFSDGRTIVIPSDENRIHGALWQNGALIEVFFYPEPVEGLDPSDRMRLAITDANGAYQAWNCNSEDALEVIEGLSKGLKRCGELGVPYNAVD
jgi:hypothetical protein